MRFVPRSKRRRRKRRALAPAITVAVCACALAAVAWWLWHPEPARQALAPVATPVPARGSASPPPATAAPPSAEPVPTAEPVASTQPRVTPRPAATASPTPGSVPAQRPRLAIIIDDCGQWPVTERAFVALPFPLTLSVLPHVRFGPAIAREADAAGKGVMLHLPMQTLSGKYPGPGTITTAMDDATIRSEVAGDLAALPQARGVNNHEGSRATADRRVMDDVADVLAGDGRFWIDSRTSAASVAATVTHARGIPSASRDVFLDDVDTIGAVEAQLRAAADRARAHGSAIAIGHPRPATLSAVRALEPALAAGGIDFTLASDLVR